MAYIHGGNIRFYNMSPVLSGQQPIIKVEHRHLRRRAKWTLQVKGAPPPYNPTSSSTTCAFIPHQLAPPDHLHHQTLILHHLQNPASITYHVEPHALIRQ